MREDEDKEPPPLQPTFKAYLRSAPTGYKAAYKKVSPVPWLLTIVLLVAACALAAFLIR